jgi:taurine dioxygenase
MTIATEPTLNVTPLGQGIGAQVDGVDLRKASPAAAREQIMAAWLKHMVLRFRGQQGMSTQQLVDFSKMFGSLDRAPTPANKTGKPYLAEFPDVTAISNIVVNGEPIGGLGSYEAEWHTDMSYNDTTPSASILYAIEIPPSGGDTWFCDMYAAYDKLPANLKARIADLKCVHDASRNSAGNRPARDHRRGAPHRAHAPGDPAQGIVSWAAAQRVHSGAEPGRERGAAEHAVAARRAS